MHTSRVGPIRFPRFVFLAVLVGVVFLTVQPVLAATIEPTNFVWASMRNFLYYNPLPAGTQSLVVFNATATGDSYWAQNVSCDGTKCTGNLQLNVNVLVPSDGCIAPYSEYHHHYSPALDGLYDYDDQSPAHPWYRSVCTPFQVEALWIDNVSPSSVSASTWPDLQFESNAPLSVPLTVSYNDWGQPVTNSNLTAVCDVDYSQTTHTCTLGYPAIFLPATAVDNTYLTIKPNLDKATGELDVLIHGTSKLGYPWEFAWGPDHPTKVPRTTDMNVNVETDTTLDVQVPTQVLFADASGSFISGYDGAGVCQPADGDAPNYCMVWVHDIPATAAWGCIRRMGSGEQIATVNPTLPPEWIADERSCPRFAVVDYDLPRLTSITPTLVAAGSEGFVLTINGEWNDTVKWWNYIDIDDWTWWSDLPDFVSITPTQMKINIPADQVGDIGTVHTVTLWTLYGDTPSATYEVVAQAPPALNSGTPEQDGGGVLVPITWTPAVTNSSIDCGTSPSQQLTGQPANCVYSAPGSYTVSGTGDGTDAEPIIVEVSSRGLTPSAITASIGGIAVTSYSASSFPVSVDLSAGFSFAAGVGVLDALDLAHSSFTVTPEGGSASPLSISNLTSSVASGTGSISAAGTYTIALAGQTLSGAQVNESMTLSISGSAPTSASISAGTPEQNGTSVLIPVTWSGGPDSPRVDCGTTLTQVHTGESIHCTYDAPGTYTIAGSYGSSQSTDPVSVTIDSLPLQSGSLSLSIGGTPTVSFVTYSTPVPVSLSASYTRPSGVGIPDTIDLTQSSFTITPESGTAWTADVSGSSTTYTGSVNLQPGTYTIALAGTTKAGNSINTSRSLVITSGSIDLTGSPLAQDGAVVDLPVTFPTVDGITPQTIDCGTSPSQVITGASGTCTYSQPGDYSVFGRFMDSLGTVGIHTHSLSINVPALQPSAAYLRATAANGVTPSQNTSGSVPIATYGAPTQYPVPVALSFTLDPPAGGQVGIIDPLDPATAVIAVKPVASSADLTSSMDGAPTVSLTQVDGTHFTASGSLSAFVDNQDNPSTWRQRFVLTGRTMTGQPLSAELYLDGPKGDGSQVGYTVQRIDPIYPYPPTSYTYRVTGLSSPVVGEPLAHSWTATNNAPTTIQGTGNFTAVFTTTGQKSASAQIGGPLSGAAQYTDPNPPVVVNPPGGIIAVTITPPASNRNRPPATYSFKPNYPPLNPGEKLQGSPAWMADANPATGYVGTTYTYSFQTAGSHTVTVSQNTTQRLLAGTANVTVNEDLPPTGSVDCSASYKKAGTPVSYVVSCKAVNAKDPDGTLKAMTWGIPELSVSKAGSTFWSYSVSTPQLLTVTLTLLDDSGSTTVLSTTVDLRTL